MTGSVGNLKKDLFANLAFKFGIDNAKEGVFFRRDIFVEDVQMMERRQVMLQLRLRQKFPV